MSPILKLIEHAKETYPHFESARGQADIAAAALEYTALVAALEQLIAQHDRPHGFGDEHWYGRELEIARAALAKGAQ